MCGEQIEKGLGKVREECAAPCRGVGSDIQKESRVPGQRLQSDKASSYPQEALQNPE